MAAPAPRPKLHIPEHATTEKVSSWARLAPASAISFAALQAKRAAAAEAERVAAAAAARVEAAEALCTQLRALEPEASAPTIDTASPPFPRLGVSLALLHLFATLVPKGTTTAEACFGFFMTLTARACSSVADGLVRLGACDPTSGLPYAAPATVFASHAWKYEFALLLEALAAFAAAQPDPSRVYVWFDCLVVNQHASAALPQEWWATAFAAGIVAIGHTCLVLAPWHGPLPLKRCWCLWEILKTVESGTPLKVQLPPSEAASFETALVTDFDSIAASMSQIDVRQSEAFKPEDQRMILGAVEKGVGFTKLNQVVAMQMQAWLAAEARAALARLPEEERGTSVLLNQLALLLQNQGKLREARALFEEAMQACRATLGDRHPDTLLSINNLALLLQDLGEREAARPLCEEALAGRRATLGDRHPSTLISIFNFARLLEDLDELEQARLLFEEAAEGATATLGEAHPHTKIFTEALTRVRT